MANPCITCFVTNGQCMDWPTIRLQRVGPRVLEDEANSLKPMNTIIGW